MQAQLAFRPTRADIDDLTDVIGKLRVELLEREAQINRLEFVLSERRATVDKAVETSSSLENLRDLDIDDKQISAKIDEMFNIDDDDDEDDDESESVVTEIDRDDGPRPDVEVGEYVRLDDEQRLQVTIIKIFIRYISNHYFEKFGAA